MICGQPAVYVGYLDPTPYHGMTGTPVRPRVIVPLSQKPFCRECTRNPTGSHRQFIVDRPAVKGETCVAPVAAASSPGEGTL